MSERNELLFNLHVDCEATQFAIRNPALGERSTRGLAEVLDAEGLVGTFLVIPTDFEAHGALYRELAEAGHEIGLHYHPWEEGRTEFFGLETRESQVALLEEAMDRFAQVMGRRPEAFCPGYGSANDQTFGVLEEVGLRHGLVSVPTRILPQCASVWGGSPLDPRYPHRLFRCLNGDVDFVDCPATIDPESRMWGGAHPQDLRVELVDAKNHFYTIQKSVKRQLAENVPVPHVHAVTHNIFEFSDCRDFRRETLVGIIAGARRVAAEHGMTLKATTMGGIAARFRERVPLPLGNLGIPKLDTRGREFATR